MTHKNDGKANTNNDASASAVTEEAKKRHLLEQFEDRIKAAIQMAKTPKSTTPTTSPEDSNEVRFPGIDDVVQRAVTAGEVAMRPMLLVYAATEIQSPKKVQELVEILSFSKQALDATREAIDRNDSAAFCRQAAVEYTWWHLLSEETQTPVERKFFATLSANVSAEGKIVFHRAYEKIKARLAAKHEENYRKMIAMGVDELVQSK